jgi:hypothetical protein
MDAPRESHGNSSSPEKAHQLELKPNRPWRFAKPASFEVSHSFIHFLVSKMA